jgi:hypothetical protein
MLEVLAALALLHLFPVLLLPMLAEAAVQHKILINK